MSRTSYSYNKLPGLDNISCSVFGLIPLGDWKQGTRGFKVTLHCGINTHFWDPAFDTGFEVVCFVSIFFAFWSKGRSVWVGIFLLNVFYLFFFFFLQRESCRGIAAYHHQGVSIQFFGSEQMNQVRVCGKEESERQNPRQKFALGGKVILPTT